ncbi:hypothetical protein Taro_015786 [Colocasia esculenta]|uniref:ARM repeat superfamily protein n=1 Tax=Colocasia esculenta TaxID=4460 RepID=A0A843UNE4_COLES|nr:hypothetical protein [Colocasia esculenta]
MPEVLLESCSVSLEFRPIEDCCAKLWSPSSSLLPVWLRPSPKQQSQTNPNQARGSDSLMHPSMAGIREVIDFVLSWPSVDADEGSRGAINSSVLTCVIQRLTSNEKWIAISEPDPCAHHEVGSLEKLSLTKKSSSNASALLTLRLCMANVLISACQKVESSRRYVLANRIIPALTTSVESIGDSDIRAACLQVLFSAVYHLKSSVLPYSSDLLKLCVKALKKGSEKVTEETHLTLEKISAAKLLASLMASEDDIIESLSAGLLEAKPALAGVLAANPSMELRQLCGKLLTCITSPLDNVFRGT